MKKVLFAFLFSIAFTFVGNASNDVIITDITNPSLGISVPTFVEISLADQPLEDIQYCARTFYSGSVSKYPDQELCASSEEAFFEIMDCIVSLCDGGGC